MAFESGECLGGYSERNELLQLHSDSGYFRFMSVDTVAGIKVWRLKVANVCWLLRAECVTAVTF